MATLLPPSRRRAREAWALGLRPRPSLWVLAGLALLLAGALELGPLAVEWLSDQLVDAFDPDRGSLEWDRLVAGSSAGMLMLLGVGLLAVVIVAPRVRARRALDVAPQVEQLPARMLVALILAALGLSVAASLGVLAGAARSVDASPEALEQAWIAWVRRGLLGVAAAAALVGTIERQLSARRLWLALHQTPEQARREAHAAGRRAPRKTPDSG